MGQKLNNRMTTDYDAILYHSQWSFLFVFFFFSSAFTVSVLGYSIAAFLATESVSCGCGFYKEVSAASWIITRTI